MTPNPLRFLYFWLVRRLGRLLFNYSSVYLGFAGVVAAAALGGGGAAGVFAASIATSLVFAAALDAEVLRTLFKSCVAIPAAADFVPPGFSGSWETDESNGTQGQCVFHKNCNVYTCCV